MNVRIYPGKASGIACAPPSKSAAHRLLICAGLANGESTIDGIQPSQDMLATMDCLRALGATVTFDERAQTARITGISVFGSAFGTLDCRECGSTLRFFVPIALLSGQPVTFAGSERLLARPLTVYETICREQGIRYEKRDTSLTVCGRLKAGTYPIDGGISSQFISGLLFALPLLDGDSTVSIIPPLESRPYIDMTLSALAAFGVSASFVDENTISIPGGQTYLAGTHTVEGDYSNAAFFEALNVLGGGVTVTGLLPDSPQGDKVYLEHFVSLMKKSPTIDLTDCPDLGPVLMAVSAVTGGAHFCGTRRLRIKESDRCAAMGEELAKFGVRSDVGENEMTVYPSNLKMPDVPLCGHNDHRIVMALAVLATRTGGVIEGAQAVSKSFPDFFERLKRIGIRTESMDRCYMEKK